MSPDATLMAESGGGGDDSGLSNPLKDVPLLSEF